MRILFIIHEAIYSGAPLALLHIIKALDRSDSSLEMNVLLLKDGPLYPEFSKICPTVVGNGKEPFFHKLLRQLRILEHWNPDYIKQMPERRYDLIYANSVATLRTALQIKQKYGFSVLVHFHESENAVKSHRIKQEMVDECDWFVAVSDLCRRNLVDSFRVSPDRIILQHPLSPWVEAIVSERYAPDFAKIEGIKGDDFVIGLSGITHWLKSDDLVPVIVKQFYKKYPSSKCKFLLLGLYDSSKNIIGFDLRKCGLSDKVIIVDRTDVPMEYYNLFNVFLLPSREDSFPLAVQENAILKKPVIMFKDATGASEWLDNSSSIQVPYLDIDATVDAIYKLYSDRGLCDAYGENAYKKVVELYRNDSRVDAIKNLINKIGNVACN